jgi:hypothetical protein
VGANWGLFSTDRERKFSLAGPVVENPDWVRHFALSSGLAVLAVLVAAASTPGLISRLRPGRAILLAVLAQGMASALVLAAHVAWTETYYTFESIRAALLFALEVALAAAILESAARLLTDPSGTKPGRLADLGDAAANMMAAVAVVATLLLVFDGRYRDFPVPDYLVPGLALPALGLMRMALQGGGLSALTLPGALMTGQQGGPISAPAASGRPRSLRDLARVAPSQMAFTALLLLGALGIVIREGVMNTEAMQWAGLLVLTTIPFAAALLQARGGVSRTGGILSASH